jgi:hypothetical protein
LATCRILIMGASYGSLLASKIVFGGHSVHLVCLPAADLINAEGFRVRLPGQGPLGPGRDRFAQAAGQGDRRRRGQCQSQGLRPGRACHARAPVPLGRSARPTRRGGDLKSSLYVDHEHAAVALPKADFWTRLRGAQACLYPIRPCGTILIRPVDAVQPRPASDPSAEREGQRAPSYAADQFQGRQVR